MRERLHCLRLALHRMLRPPPFVDEDPQSTAEATAVRTAWVRRNRPDRR